MEDKFIYCFDEDNRIKLEKQGYKLIKTTMVGNQKGYIFENNNVKKIKFDLSSVFVSNRMDF